MFYRKVINWVAIVRSQLKWVGIAYFGAKDRGSSDCALCRLYNHKKPYKYFITNTGPCDGCPIKLETGRAGCASTPYESYVDFYTTKETRSIWAKAELNFLGNLRKNGKWRNE